MEDETLQPESYTSRLMAFEAGMHAVDFLRAKAIRRGEDLVPGDRASWIEYGGKLEFSATLLAIEAENFFASLGLNWLEVSERWGSLEEILLNARLRESMFNEVSNELQYLRDWWVIGWAVQWSILRPDLDDLRILREHSESIKKAIDSVDGKNPDLLIQQLRALAIAQDVTSESM